MKKILLVFAAMMVVTGASAQGPAVGKTITAVGKASRVAERAATVAAKASYDVSRQLNQPNIRLTDPIYNKYGKIASFGPTGIGLTNPTLTGIGTKPSGPEGIPQPQKTSSETAVTQTERITFSMLKRLAAEYKANEKKRP